MQPSELANIDLIDPSGILPDVFYTTGSESRSPEAWLVLAVLEEALRTFCVNCSKETNKARALTEEVERWTQRTCEPTPWFGFYDICTHLNLDPEFIRRQMAEIKERLQAAPRIPYKRAFNCHRIAHRRAGTSSC